VGFQEAPHLQDLSKISLQMPKAEFPKRNFSLIGEGKSKKTEEGRLKPSKQRETKQWFELEQSSTK
jgi:hypothetical protein